MKKSNLETAIEKAAAGFAIEIVNAVKAATLQELIALQESVPAAPPTRKKPGPKPGAKRVATKARKKPGPKPGSKRVATKARKKPGPKPGAKRAVKKEPSKAATKNSEASNKRVMRNYPKCVYPGCTNNRFVRGQGYCGVHWKAWKDGKIKAPVKP